MAICGNCGQQASRIRTTFHEDGHGKCTGKTDECPWCSPGTFEPKWWNERGAAAWEAYPTKYRKIVGPNGEVGYESTDEWRADTEARLSKECQEDIDARAKEIEKKRASRRTRPLSPAEIESITNRYMEQKKQAERELGARAAGLVI